MHRQKHSIKTRLKMRQQKLGRKNHRWVEKNPSYGSVHMWLDKNFKKLKTCQKCGSERFIEWAKKKGKKHDHKRENYLCLCSSCHKKYDYTLEHRKNTSDALKGRKITWGKKISESHIRNGVRPSVEAIRKSIASNKRNPRKRNKDGEYV